MNGFDFPRRCVDDDFDESMTGSYGSRPTKTKPVNLHTKTGN
jgi:hypothetical protein